MVNLRNQERIEQTFGVYVGEVEDGKPHGQGVCNFNKDDIIVSENELKLHITNFFFFLYMVFNDTHTYVYIYIDQKFDLVKISKGCQSQ